MRKHIESLLLVFIILTLFTGCHNLAVNTATLPSPENVAASDGFCCVVSGRVSTEPDAAAGARTALPSLNLTGEVTITAIFYNTTAGIPDVTGTYDTENKTFSVPLTKEGEWTISAESGTYSGATTVTITRDTLVKNDIALKMKPDMSTLSGTGTISLPVSIEEGTGINKIAMTFTDSLSTVHTPDITLTSTTGTLNETGVAVGAYSATIRAYDTAGALVFQCTESLLVLPDETTNNWVISSADVTASPYLSIDEAGTVQFKITNACLENFARTSYYAAPYGDDTEGDGSQGNPFLTLKKAADTIMLYNDGVSEYTLFIEDDITYSSAADAFSISLPEDYTKDLKVKLTSDSTTACTVNANGLTNVLKVINSSTKKCILTVENVVLSGGNGSSGSGIYISGNDSNITATKLILNSGVEISNSLNTYTMSGIGITVFNGSFEMNDGSKITGSDYSLSYNYFMGGGGLYLLGSEAIINGGEISGFNFSTTNITGPGAAIYASQSNVIMNGGRITDNTISGSASRSGTIIYLAESGYIMNGGTISNNSITGIGNASGGAFYISDADSSVTLNSGNISNNAVKGSGSKGGAIYHNGGTLTINGGSFYNNSAENGGAVYSTLSESSEIIISGGYFFANTATKGAGMYLVSSAGSATLKGSPLFLQADDIYLEKPASGDIKPLNIDGALLKPFNPDYDVATITPGEYTEGTVVLTGSGVSSACSLFALKDAKYRIDTEGKLKEIHLSVNKAYVSKADSNNNRTVSIIKDTDRSSSSLDVQQVILKKGEETKATFTDNPFIVPDTLDAGDYTIEVTATYKGSTLSDTIVFEIIERLDTIGWLTTAPSSGEYYISREESFTQLADWIKSGSSMSGVTIDLDDDVSLSDNFSFGECTEYSSLKPFSGTFDGKGHTLSNISITQTGSRNYHGLFPKVTNGTIKNVILEGTETAGSIAGLVDGNSLIENCISKITTIKNSTFNTGGLVADLRSGTIRNCINYSNVQSSNNFAGGIVGETGGNDKQCYIESCMNYGNITCDGYLVGGICGEINSKCDIVNCANYGALTGAYSVGGIVGKIDSWGLCHLNNNISIGQITLTNSQGSNTNLCGLLSGYESSSTTNSVQYQYNYCLNLQITYNNTSITPSTRFFPENAVTEGCTGEHTIREPNYLFTHYGQSSTLVDDFEGQPIGVTIGSTTTDSLLGALNAWVNIQGTPTQYCSWAIDDTDSESKSYGYPVLDFVLNLQ